MFLGAPCFACCHPTPALIDESPPDTLAHFKSGDKSFMGFAPLLSPAARLWLGRGLSTPARCTSTTIRPKRWVHTSAALGQASNGCRSPGWPTLWGPGCRRHGLLVAAEAAAEASTMGEQQAEEEEEELVERPTNTLVGQRCRPGG